MFKTIPTLPPILSEWAHLLNAVHLRREPQIVGTRFDGTDATIRFLAPLTCGWVQVHIQSDAGGEGGLAAYDPSNYTSSTKVDCRADRLQDATFTPAGGGVRYVVFLVPIQEDGEGNAILYDGVGTPDQMAFSDLGI